MKNIKSHREGTLETVKFAHRKVDYEQYLLKLSAQGRSIPELLHHFPAFVGKMTLNRCFTLYELYKSVIGVSGHIAEIGVYKGFGSILFGKLIELFEPESLTMVHGFDHFKGIDPTTDAALQVPGGDASDESQLREIIELQGLDNTIKIHNLDATTDFPEFFESNPHLRFKLVFLDSGTYKVTSASLQAFWHRITPGGILILDQFNNEVAPGETEAVCEFFKNRKIETIPNSWMPNAFVRKT